MKAVTLTAAVVTAAFGFTDLLAAESPAAELKQIKGSVLVNKGETYRTAPEGTTLQVGDRLMVMDGSSMVLVYRDGCIAEFKQNQIITVEEVSTCEGGNAAYVEKSPMYADPMGGGGPTGGGGGGGDLFGLGPGWTAGIIGGIGLTGVAIAAGTSNGDDRISGE
jgi:hypothetical protein